MRPDEHKQKKNAAYKKKHGIGGKDSSNKEKIKKAPKEDVTPGKDRQIAPKTKISDSSDNEDQELLPTKNKGFQRRKIVSNWEKYEIGPEDDAVAHSGKDYKELLSMAGEAMSHFRLTDELDWGENETSVDRTEPHSDYVLSLDPQDIARSLSCLPVHTVLGIPQNMVTEEDLSLAAKIAMENESKFGRRNSDTTLTKEDVNMKKSCATVVSPHHLRSPAMETTEGDISKLKDNVDSKLEPNLDSSKKHVEVTSPQTNNIHIMEDELDALLDLDEPSSNPQKTVPQVSPPQTDNIHDMEDELDALLDLDEP